MKNIKDFYLKNFNFLEVKFSIYLDRRIFVMKCLFLRNTEPLHRFKKKKKKKKNDPWEQWTHSENWKDEKSFMGLWATANLAYNERLTVYFSLLTMDLSEIARWVANWRCLIWVYTIFSGLFARFLRTSTTFLNQSNCSEIIPGSAPVFTRKKKEICYINPSPAEPRYVLPFQIV